MCICTKITANIYVPGGCQDNVGWHLRQEGDDGTSEVAVPVPASHLRLRVLSGGH